MKTDMEIDAIVTDTINNALGDISFDKIYPRAWFAIARSMYLDGVRDGHREAVDKVMKQIEKTDVGVIPQT